MWNIVIFIIIIIEADGPVWALMVGNDRKHQKKQYKHQRKNWAARYKEQIIFPWAPFDRFLKNFALMFLGSLCPWKNLIPYK